MMSNLVFLLILLSSSLLHSLTFAAPATTHLDLAKRQDGSPITVVTVDTVQGVTETCNVTLTPITANGQAAFREEKSCTQSSSSSNNNNNSPPAATSQSSDTQTTSTSSDTVVQQSTATTDISTSISAEASATQSSTLTSALVAPTDVSVIGASTADSGILSTGASNPETTPAATSTSAVVVAPTDFSILGASSIDAASASANAALATSLTAGAPNTTATTAAFAIPGKQIQVLPIGLGVFAGVSVIALIVVGLVTYERTKYRKKFRKEKLAESAAPMGYGGMAERS